APVSPSAVLACRRARSKVRVMKACVCSSYCSTRAISASTSSTGESFRAASRRAGAQLAGGGLRAGERARELRDREVVQVGRHGDVLSAVSIALTALGAMATLGP